MKVFLLNSKENAQICRQLIRLDGECASLSWSKSIQDIPEEVQDALETVQNFIKDRLHTLCSDDVLQMELIDEQEDAVFAVCKKSANLKKILGSGVILAGEESSIVKAELLNMCELGIIQDLLASDNNLVFL